MNRARAEAVGAELLRAEWIEPASGNGFDVEIVRATGSLSSVLPDFDQGYAELVVAVLVRDQKPVDGSERMAYLGIKSSTVWRALIDRDDAGDPALIVEQFRAGNWGSRTSLDHRHWDRGHRGDYPATRRLSALDDRAVHADRRYGQRLADRRLLFR